MKDKIWLKDSITKEMQDLFSTTNPNYFDFEYTNKKIRGLVNQLDEPEVLSQEWISENAVVGQYPDGMGYVLPAYKLQNLLVPKQKEVKVPQFIANYLPLVKEDVELERVSYYAVTNNELPKWKKEYDWIRENFETFVKAWLAYPNIEVEEEPKYIIKTGDERYLSQLALNYVDNPPVTTVHHMKELAIKFNDRELAQRVADLVNNGEVEELEE